MAFLRTIQRAESRLVREADAVDVKVKYSSDQTKWLIKLIDAAKRGRTSEVEKLVGEMVEEVHDLDMVDSKGRTALHWAALKDKSRVVYALLEAGAEVDAEREADGATPLFLAAEAGSNNAAYALMEYEADVDAQRTTDGATPLYIACCNGHSAVSCVARRACACMSRRSGALLSCPTLRRRRCRSRSNPLRRPSALHSTVTPPQVVDSLIEFEADVNVTQFQDVRAPPRGDAIVASTGYRPAGKPAKSTAYGIFRAGQPIEVLAGRARDAKWMAGIVAEAHVPRRSSLGYCDSRLIVSIAEIDEDEAAARGVAPRVASTFEVLKASDEMEGKGDQSGQHISLTYKYTLEERVRASEHCHSLGRRSGWEMAGNSPLIAASVNNNVTCVKALLRAGASKEFCNKHGKCAGDYLRELYFLDIDTLLRERDLYK